MTCDDVERLLHPFVDTELPPPMLLAVARHAGSCLACDAAIRELTELREVLVGSVECGVEGLDLSGVWAGVSRAIDGRDHRRAHRAREARRLPRWAGSGLALAASVLLALGLYVGRDGRGAKPEPPVPEPQTIAQAPRSTAVARLPVRARRPPNYAAFDRLWGRGIEVKREPKSGTTVVWVNHLEGADE